MGPLLLMEIIAVFNMCAVPYSYNSSAYTAFSHMTAEPIRGNNWVLTLLLGIVEVQPGCVPMIYCTHSVSHDGKRVF